MHCWASVEHSITLLFAPFEVTTRSYARLTLRRPRVLAAVVNRPLLQFGHCEQAMVTRFDTRSLRLRCLFAFDTAFLIVVLERT